MNEERIEPKYSEKVLPNWSSFIPVLAVYPTLWLTFLPINESIGVWSGLVATVLVTLLMIAKSARIRITQKTIEVSGASIERTFVTGVEVVAKTEAFVARGRELDPRAWIHFQGSVNTLVRVRINDPADPTPYWLFSTRHPERIKEILGF